MGRWEDDLDDDERAAVIATLREKIDREWPYRLAPRMLPFTSALAKLDSNAARAPKPEPRPQLKPPSVGSNRRGGRRRQSRGHL